MNFQDAIRACYSKFVTFNGRASRPEFWYFYLFYVIVSFATNIFTNSQSNFNSVTSLAVTIGVGLPLLAAQVRRLHDVGRSGWWVGGLVLSVAVLVVLVIAAIASSIVGSFSIDTATTAEMDAFTASISGWIPYLLVSFLVSCGLGITVFIFTVLPSKPGPNKYGEAPAALTASATSSGSVPPPPAGYTPLS